MIEHGTHWAESLEEQSIQVIILINAHLGNLIAKAVCVGNKEEVVGEGL